ncbi:MAG: gamma-glutamyl-gamma-aminobutyrate hydrolase family protein [Eubacteriales bacterium]|nr:gamma-glutamyl-gamma-aminobutyrate hydrolase family protein [Eubacteriales bacterium]
MSITIGIASPSAALQNYTAALAEAGKRTGIHVLTKISTQPDEAAGWDALLLPGGGDLDPALLPDDPSLSSYTQRAHPSCTDIDPGLDRKQLALLALFAREKKPVLGICKGMQLINIHFGGGLCQDLPQAARHRRLKSDQLHSSCALPGSVLARLYGERFFVNSAHHQGITFTGPDISVLQHSDDGVPEAILHKSLPVLGLQWHPERLCRSFSRPDAADGSAVLSWFVRLTASRTGKRRH